MSDLLLRQSWVHNIHNINEYPYDCETARWGRKEMMGIEPPGERGCQSGFKGCGGAHETSSMFFRRQNRIVILRIEFEPPSLQLFWQTRRLQRADRLAVASHHNNTRRLLVRGHFAINGGAAHTEFDYLFDR
jgi:hypothetical protein